MSSVCWTYLIGFFIWIYWNSVFLLGILNFLVFCKYSIFALASFDREIIISRSVSNNLTIRNSGLVLSSMLYYFSSSCILNSYSWWFFYCVLFFFFFNVDRSFDFSDDNILLRVLIFVLPVSRETSSRLQFNSRYERIKNWAAITAGYYIQFFHIPMMSPWTPILSLLVQKSFQKNCSTLYQLIPELENIHVGKNILALIFLLILLLSITSLHFLLF